MHRSRALLAAMAFLPGIASAQIVGKELSNAVQKDDLSATAPVVQAILNEDKPGAKREWHSGERGGHVRLLSGGAKAGETCGKVRVTTIAAGVESKGYAFRYCRDGAGKWRTAG